MTAALRFPAETLPADAPALRHEVRAFLAGHAAAWDETVIAQSWVGFDREFSLAVGARGWIGMTWPRRYGGQEMSMLHRYVVLEEMLAVGAPIGAHSTGDRQSGPLLLRLGTEAQKARILPPLARGELSICVGLSEPDAGSDLAAIRSRAERTPQGWRLNGRKIWTTNAHRSEYMLALFRSSGGPEARQEGLSQFLIDLSTPGIEIRGIRDLSGHYHFNEVTFDDVLIPEDALIGVEGDGWRQVTAELAFERSGPDRYMSAYPLLERLARRPECGVGSEPRRLLGQAIGELAVLREMSLSIAGRLARGETPNLEAAVVKELGVAFEQSLPDIARAVLAACEGAPSPELTRLLNATIEIAPTYSIRGGAREIMQGIVARGLGLR